MTWSQFGRRDHQPPDAMPNANGADAGILFARGSFATVMPTALGLSRHASDAINARSQDELLQLIVGAALIGRSDWYLRV